MDEKENTLRERATILRYIYISYLVIYVLGNLREKPLSVVWNFGDSWTNATETWAKTQRFIGVCQPYYLPDAFRTPACSIEADVRASYKAISSNSMCCCVPCSEQVHVFGT